ncbi:MAG: Rieske 2Fe-2S domain-containing protein [Planctomycetes bacterium]|nr:Rieske 2Fe-2S domain-containing protein [Planctomycetota bacterium]
MVPDDACTERAPDDLGPGPWQRIGPVAALRFDPGAVVRVRGAEIAVFRLADRWVGVENSCPHAGAALADGDLRGDILSCLWHGWSFDLRTGRCTTFRDVAVRTWQVVERDGSLWIAPGPRATG